LSKRTKQCDDVTLALDVSSVDNSLHSAHATDDDDDDDDLCSEMTDVSQVILCHLLIGIFMEQPFIITLPCYYVRAVKHV